VKLGVVRQKRGEIGQNGCEAYKKTRRSCQAAGLIDRFLKQLQVHACTGYNIGSDVSLQPAGSFVIALQRIPYSKDKVPFLKESYCMHFKQHRVCAELLTGTLYCTSAHSGVHG